MATGHNLDDEAAVLLQNVLHWQTGHLLRQAPVLPSTHPRLARKVKPFLRFYERETAAYAILRGIDYIYEECPFATGATTIFYKELLNRLEERSRGQSYSFISVSYEPGRRGFSFRCCPSLACHVPGQAVLRPSGVRGKGSQGPERISSVDKGLELGECERCGQPTTAPGLCAFCRLWEVAEAEAR